MFKRTGGVLKDENYLFSKLIQKLEDEFMRLLYTYGKPVETDQLFECLPNPLRPSGFPGHQGDNCKNPSSTDNSEHQAKSLQVAECKPLTLVPVRILTLLHDIAQELIQAGFQHKCVQIYRETRASVLEQNLRRLGLEILAEDDVHKMHWDVLEGKIGIWIKSITTAVKLLFPGEWRVCDQIFDIRLQKDYCFAGVITKSVTMLLSFGDAVAESKRSPEKLFVLLDMYERMCELQPEIENIFKGKACSEIQKCALILTKRLAKTAQETLAVFVEVVENDATKAVILDGDIHPLTKYVINYVKFLIDYQSTLKQIFQEFEPRGDPDYQLESVTMRIMQVLQCNLDGKSKQYKDLSLTYLFLMNNIHDMVRFVRRSEAKNLLGDDWVQRHRRVVQQNANKYKRVAWSKLLQCLSIQGLTSSGGSTGEADGDISNRVTGVSRALVKERFKYFNMQFDKLRQRQSQWIVPDHELRESLRLAIAEVLLPAYSSFVEHLRPLLENGNPGKYVKMKVEDLEEMLSQFFEGKALIDSKSPGSKHGRYFSFTS